jgi:hypothetical protein
MRIQLSGSNLLENHAVQGPVPPHRLNSGSNQKSGMQNSYMQSSFTKRTKAHLPSVDCQTSNMGYRTEPAYIIMTKQCTLKGDLLVSKFPNSNATSLNI